MMNFDVTSFESNWIIHNIMNDCVDFSVSTFGQDCRLHPKKFILVCMKNFHQAVIITKSTCRPAVRKAKLLPCIYARAFIVHVKNRKRQVLKRYNHTRKDLERLLPRSKRAVIITKSTSSRWERLKSSRAFIVHVKNRKRQVLKRYDHTRKGLERLLLRPKRWSLRSQLVAGEKG